MKNHHITRKTIVFTLLVFFFYLVSVVTAHPALSEILAITSSTNSTLFNSQNSIVLLPLEQIRSGIPLQDIVCKESLHLIIKTEDGSPACVKYGTAQKLIERGWTKMFVQSTAWNSQTMCAGSEVPSGDFRNRIFPILMMPQNSTAMVCVTYNFKSDWKLYPNKDLSPHGILETCCFIHMRQISNSIPSNKFEILSNPSLFNMTNVYNGSKINVIYKIHAKFDSKGFYDTSIPFDGCLSYPLVVGYDVSEINTAKFHSDFSVPCSNTIIDVYSVKIVSGMTYKEMQFPRDYP
jgi:hypothetical protein